MAKCSDDTVKDTLSQMVENEFSQSLDQLSQDLEKAEQDNDKKLQDKIKEKIKDKIKDLAEKYGGAVAGKVAGAAFGAGTVIGDTFAAVMNHSIDKMMGPGTKAAYTSICGGSQHIPKFPAGGKRFNCAFMVISYIKGDPADPYYDIEVQFTNGPSLTVTGVGLQVEHTTQMRKTHVTDANIATYNIDDNCPPGSVQEIIPNPPHCCFYPECIAKKGTAGSGAIIYTAYVFAESKCKKKSATRERRR